MKSQVAIIGAGPAGMLLSELLNRRGIESVVLERQSRAHVLSRIRAGVLEQTTVDVLRTNGLSERMDREGQRHDGMKIVWAGRGRRRR
jgi:p-hydroxybenzoate 3-monooxygenase